MSHLCRIYLGENAVPKTSGIRIFVEAELVSGMTVALGAEQSHYLLSVMRLTAGCPLLAFNGIDGEYECELGVAGKKTALINVLRQSREFYAVPDVWLMFAPLKKDRTDFVIEKATELGASRIVPVITRYAISDKVKAERWRAQAIEAAEQSRRLEVPVIDEAVSLEKLLQQWDETRRLYFMDETGTGLSVASVFQDAPAPAAFLIGPEGGFSEQELELLRSKPFSRAVNLGKRILRAETAALAALSCWQALSGDWK